MTIDYEESTQPIEVHVLCGTCNKENCYCDEQTMELMDNELREEDSYYEPDCA